MTEKLLPPFRCGKCRVILTDKNWYKSAKKNRHFVCKKCHDVRVNRWEKEHPEETKTLGRNWKRNNQITTWRKGKKIYLKGNKRKYPKENKCELCGIKSLKRLSYHHWDDKNLSKGLWVDFKCHMFAEVVDKLGIEILNIYNLLKRKINES